MSKKQSQSKRLEIQLRDWKTRFEAQREAAGDAPSAADRERLEAAKVSGDLAFKKLKEMRATAAHWGVLKDELTGLLREIDDLVPGAVPVTAER